MTNRARLRLLACLCLPPLATAQSGWSAPNPVVELNSPDSDSAPHLSLDGSTIWFGSFRSGDWEIWSATRPAKGAPFGNPVHEVALGSSSTESGPFVTADGLEIWFESLRAGGQGGFDVMRATRPTTNSPWGAPTFVPEVNSPASEASVTMTADGLELYLLSSGFGAPYAPNNSIFVAKRPNPASPFGTPVLVAELAATQGSNTSHRDVDLSPDGLSIFFTRSDPNTRRIEVHEARRTSRSRPFGQPVVLAEFSNVGTLSGVFSVSVSADGHEMFLAAGFSPSAGSQEIMVSTFEGLTTSGIASTTGALDLHFRDSTSPNGYYAFALAFGNTGFPLGARHIPLDPDPLMLATLGTDVPGISTAFFGTLDPSGEVTGQVRNPIPLFTGLHLWAGAFAFDPQAPFGVETISNVREIELH